jgi:hypothetical protein
MLFKLVPKRMLCWGWDVWDYKTTPNPEYDDVLERAYLTGRHTRLVFILPEKCGNDMCELNLQFSNLPFTDIYQYKDDGVAISRIRYSEESNNITVTIEASGEGALKRTCQVNPAGLPIHWRW